MKIFLPLLLAAFTAGCAPAAPKTDLTIAVPTEPPSLTPYAQNDTQSYRVRWQIFEKLISMETNGTLIPALAVSWSNISPTVFQVKLRQGVTFHNGKPFTAKDVKYSVETASLAPTLRSILSVIARAEIVDEQTVNIIMKAPYAAAAILMTHPGLLMVNEETQLAAGTNEVYVGTGPYKFVEWKRGDSIILSQNESHWGGVPAFKKVHFRIVPDDAVRAIAVETGEVDIAYDIAGGDRDRFVKGTKVQFNEAVMPRMEYLGFNVGKPVNAAWTNKTLREAVSYAIDYQGIVDSVLFGGATPASSMLAPMIFGANTNLPVRTRNIEKAKEIFAKSGAPAGLKAKIYVMEGYRKKVGEVIQANLRDIGINAEVVVYEWGKLLESAGKGELELFLLGWTSIPSDADIGMYALSHSSSKGLPGNYTFYSTPELDRLLDAGRQEQDPAKRIALYVKAQEIVYNDAAIIPIFYLYNNAALAKNLKGFVLNQFGIHEIKYLSR